MGEKSLKKAMAFPASSMEPLEVEGCFFLVTSTGGLLVLVGVVVFVVVVGGVLGVLEVVPSVGKNGGYTGL